jgi:predicted amidohydrolase YtcJ
MRTRVLALANSTLGSDELTADLRSTVARLRRHQHDRDGRSRLHAGGVKAFLDGGASMGTALLDEPWPGRPDYRGELVFTAEQLEHIARFCVAESLPLGVHAVGNAAVRIALETFERVDALGPIAPLRFSIIHGYLWPSPASMALAARLGVAVASQPAMQWAFADRLAGVFGDEAIGRAHPFRSWLDAGVVVAGGSDHPAIPLSPSLAMAAARSRTVKGRDEPLGKAESISAFEALQLYTVSSAWLAFAEESRGRLAPGTDADWTVIEVDPLIASADELAQVEATETVIAGQQVY